MCFLTEFNALDMMVTTLCGYSARSQTKLLYYSSLCVAYTYMLLSYFYFEQNTEKLFFKLLILCNSMIKYRISMKKYFYR